MEVKVLRCDVGLWMCACVRWWEGNHVCLMCRCSPPVLFIYSMEFTCHAPNLEARTVFREWGIFFWACLSRGKRWHSLGAGGSQVKKSLVEPRRSQACAGSDNSSLKSCSKPPQQVTQSSNPSWVERAKVTGLWLVQKIAPFTFCLSQHS